MLLVLLAGIVLALTGDRGAGGRLDPRSAKGSGARAVAQLLTHAGVDVELVTTSAAMSAAASRGDTVLVADPLMLAGSQTTAVMATGADVVVLGAVDPLPWLPGVPGLIAAPAEADVRSADCELQVAMRAGTVDAGVIGYRVQKPAPGLATCYAKAGAATLVQAGGQSTVTLLGSTAPLRNSRLDDEGNAALALGLLGTRPHLVWYLPSPSDVPASVQKSFYALVPDAVWWGLAQLAIAVLLLGLWRARRLGPVVVEPLPVVVHAAETVEGRARLYRRSGARGQAAEALRSGVRARLVTAFTLPRRSDPVALVAATAARSGLPGPQVQALLYGSAPADDAALVALADDLDALERQVRRP